MGPRDELRHRLRLNHEERIKVISVFACTSCDATMLWVPEKLWWGCPECHCEVTPAEALVLLKQTLSSVDALNLDVEKKFGVKGRVSWLSMLLGKLFGRSNRLPP